MDARGEKIYAAAGNQGLYRLVGDTWTQAGSALPDGPVKTVAVHPGAPQFVALAYYNDAEDATDNHGVYLSRDGADTFEYVGLEGVWIFEVSFLPNESTLLVASYGQGIHRLTF